MFDAFIDQFWKTKREAYETLSLLKIKEVLKRK